MMAMYDVADAPSGLIGKMEGDLLQADRRLTVIDNQRGDAEAMFASHIGSKRGQAWADIGSKEQRVLRRFRHQRAGMEGAARRRVDQARGQHLFVSEPCAETVRRPGQGLYRGSPSDGAGPHGRPGGHRQSARGPRTAAGHHLHRPCRLCGADARGPRPRHALRQELPAGHADQYRVAAVVPVQDLAGRPGTCAWERDIYGTIGDGRYDRAAGLVEAAVGAIVFGVASEAVRDTIQGKDPIAKLKEHPFAVMAEGAQRSGFGSLVGDFLLGQFDRHGFSPWPRLAGPTYAQIDTLMGILHGEGDSAIGALLGVEGEQKGQHPGAAARPN